MLTHKIQSSKTKETLFFTILQAQYNETAQLMAGQTPLSHTKKHVATPLMKVLLKRFVAPTSTVCVGDLT